MLATIKEDLVRVPKLQCSFLALWAHKFVNSAPCWPHGPPQALFPGCLLPEDRGWRPVWAWDSFVLPFRLLPS